MILSSNSQICNQLQYALFAADMAILIEDENRKIQFVNQTYCDLLELPMKPDELLGYDFSTTALFSRYNFQDVDEFSRKASQFESDRIIKRDDRLVTKSGITILRDYVPIVVDGENKGNIWYFKKVDKVIESDTHINNTIFEQNLTLVKKDISHESINFKIDDKYSRIINSLNDIVFELDLDGNIKYLNKSWERLAECKVEESLDKNIKYYFTQNHYDQDIQFDRLLSQAKGEIDDNTYPFVAKSGFKWVSIDIEPLYEGNKHSGFSGIMIDITEKKLAEEQLQINYLKEKNINEMKSKLVSMISHEFRTPLAAISSSVELMQFLNESNKLEANPKTNELIFKINDQISKMGGLIDGVLLINKIDSGKLKPQYTEIDLVDLLNDTIEEYSSTDFVFNIETDAKELKILADRELLKKAFNNIISNAIIYSLNQNVIDVNIHKNCTVAEVTIKDRGIGIPKEEQTNLFTSFFRGSNIRNISGVGLGLVVSKHILGLHKALINIDSKENVGTEVKVSFELPELENI